MSTLPPREQFLVISALGPAPMELTSVLCRAAQECRCNVTSSRLTRHGEYSALVLQVSGSWDALARLEANLGPLAKRHKLSLNLIRSAAAEERPNALPYVVYVSAAYRPDILGELCQFFSDQRVELESLTCDTYQAPQTGTLLLNATITVTLPPGTQISWLRDQFLDFADALNLDALIEPWRPQNP
ncbi:glycine cleavage system protein R [Pseudomonas sp. GCM10022188]|uniref:glycine cleavage system protein R n=1 Tax=Pseudomonas TaxID=286 RepID=UPI001E654662|nr:glycine cleavage system protein R [Pseudomonas oryzagri]MCC6076187.1 glycine cleavage system protein R [Pseudomonas oryzagri]